MQIVDWLFSPFLKDNFTPETSLAQSWTTFLEIGLLHKTVLNIFHILYLSDKPPR